MDPIAHVTQLGPATVQAKNRWVLGVCNSIVKLRFDKGNYHNPLVLGRDRTLIRDIEYGNHPTHSIFVRSCICQMIQNDD